jgi:hypothetical protein
MLFEFITVACVTIGLVVGYTQLGFCNIPIYTVSKNYINTDYGSGFIDITYATT